MGVAIALGAAGIASGVMGAMGQQSEAEAQYMAQKIEVERNNFLNSLKNDKQNFATARANAQRRWNNQQIATAAVKNLADQKRANRKNWKANIHNSAKQQTLFMASLDAQSTGRGMRGGTADALERQAKADFRKNRHSLTMQKYQADTSASAQYEAQLSKRDMLSYGTASIYMPGSTGVEPGNGNLNMLAGILGGASSGISAGMGAQSSMQSVQWGQTPLAGLLG